MPNSKNSFCSSWNLTAVCVLCTIYWFNAYCITYMHEDTYDCSWFCMGIDKHCPAIVLLALLVDLSVHTTLSHAVTADSLPY